MLRPVRTNKRLSGAARHGLAEALHRGLCRLTDRGTNALERSAKALFTEGLEEIVECAQLEGGHRMPGMGRREHHESLMAQALQHLETRCARHLDVEEHEVGMQRLDDQHGLGAARRFADAIDPLDLEEHPAQACPRDRLVVDNQRTDLRAVTQATACGTVSDATNPPAGTAPSSIRARIP